MRVLRTAARDTSGPHTKNKGLPKEIRLSGWLLIFVLLIVSLNAVALPKGSSTNTLSASQVIQFLDQTIGWYRELAVQQQIASEPTDLIVVYDNRQTADQVVRLAFDFARGETESIAKQGSSNQGQSGASSQYQSLLQLQAKLEEQVQDTQAELDSDRQKLATATGSKRQELQSQVSELQGELELANARRDAMRSMVEFVSGTSTNGLGATGLRAQVEALAGSVPATSSSSFNPVPNPSPASVSNKPVTSGIWDLTTDVFSLSAKVHTIDSVIQQTNALARTTKEIRAPLVSQLRELSDRGDELANQADTANQSELGKERQQLDALATQFKQISAAVIPLSKQGVLLDVYHKGISQTGGTLLGVSTGPS